jgi:hypothetical protein
MALMLKEVQCLALHINRDIPISDDSPQFSEPPVSLVSLQLRIQDPVHQPPAAATRCWVASSSEYFHQVCELLTHTESELRIERALK